MYSLEILGFLLGTSFASGLNLYATVAALGLLHRYHVIDLPASLDVLANPAVLGVAIALYIVEFVADKVPYVDNVWDVVHTFIRPPAAAVLAYAAVAEAPENLRVVAALVAGSVALTSHGTKASARVAVNASPEPVSNSALSLGEDGFALGLTWMAAAHPVWTFALVLVLLGLSAFLIFKFFGLVRRSLQKLLARSPRNQEAP